MADQHPITPPPELKQQWREQAPRHLIQGREDWVMDRASQWGADQELKACCEWLDYNCPSVGAHHLRAARRPKPPTLAEQGMQALRSIPCTEQRHYDALFAALNRLAELEDSMTDQHPITPPPRLADAALAALGGRLDEGDCWADFHVIGPDNYARIRAALERLKQLESYLS